MTNITFKMTEEEYLEHVSNDEGICLNCGEFRDSTEPDAENYPCEFCNENKVMGLELALIAGHIDINDGEINEN